jgi:transposase
MPPKTTRHELSAEERGIIIGMKMARTPLTEISSNTHHPITTVSSVIQRWEQTGTTASAPRSGRPLLLSPRDLRRIDLYISKNASTRRQTLKGVIEALDLEVSSKTLQRALEHLGYKRRIARVKPILTKKDMKQRLAFARKYKDWTAEEWGRVIWTDESSIKVGETRSGNCWVWRKKGEALHPDCVEKKKKRGTGNTFWGAFRLKKKGPGFFIKPERGENGKPKSITSATYRDQVLTDPLQQFRLESREELGEEPLIMEDNAPTHKKYAIPARNALGFESMNWPPNSPDLNPIENVWYVIKEQIFKDHWKVTSTGEMEEVVKKIWNEFPQEKMDNLVKSMERRINLILETKGGYIKY